MIVTLYCEGSLCPATGAAGWGCYVDGSRERDVAIGGHLHGSFAGTTMMELSAVQSAFAMAEARGLVQPGDAVVIAMRSTAALAVLRWVFKDAEFRGDIQVEAPKRLAPAVREADCLVELDDDVDRVGVNIALRHVRETLDTLTALNLARIHMEADRHSRRRTAR